MNTSDQHLLDAIARKDRSAFERVYRTHKDDLLTVTAVLLGERGLAEDVLHDVFISLARRAKQIRLVGTLRNYLITSCLNRARDMLARRNREIAGTPVLDELTATSPCGDPVEADEELRRLSVALQMLPAEQREVVTLHIHGRLTFREISELLEISPNTAQSRYRYALAKLRDNLSESQLLNRRQSHDK